MSKRALIIIGVAIVAVVAGWWAYQRMTGDETAEADAQETVVVERGTLESTVGGTGSLGAAQEVELSFSSGGGEVAEVLVSEGDAVVAGQPLAVLDTRDLVLALESAEANLTSARSGVTTAQTNLDSLQEGAGENELAIAKVQLDQARDKLWGSQAQRDGVCGRVEAGRGQDYECDSQEASVLQAEDAVRIAELQYEQLLDGASDDEVDNARDKLTQAQAQVASSEASVAQSRLRLEQATLSSPIDGTVTVLNAKVGETASSSLPAVTIGTVDDLEVVISLDETDVASVAVGMDAVVVLDAFPDDELPGSVTTIAPIAQTQSGVVLFPVTVQLDVADVPARPGMTADVEIVTQQVADALIVPLRAIVSTPRGDFVAVVSPEGEDAADVGAFAAMRGEGGEGGERGAGGAAGAAGAAGAGGAGGAAGAAGAAGTGGERGAGAEAGERAKRGEMREGGELGEGEGFAGGREMPAGMQLPEGMTREDMAAMRERAMAEGGAMMGQGGAFAAQMSAQMGIEGARFVPVTIGATTDTSVQIVSGVAAGDVLIVPSTSSSSDAPPGGFGMPPMMGGGMMRGR